ncbi:MAG: DUF3667 domain-containing protein [Sphingobacteriales bacterium]|nr:MAG: DUF3667 domain-containing protein [Sphingobacteriales bacterium]
MQTKCLNCQADVRSANYCASCGQSTKHERLLVPVIIDDFTHAFLHTDKSILKLIPGLAYKPGIIARDYVNGKRKSLHNPFNFVVLTVAISSFIIIASGVDVFNGSSKDEPVMRLAQQHFNLVILLTVPILVFTTWLFVRKQYNFAECAVLVAYTSGFRSLFHTFLFIPLQYFFPQMFSIGIPVYMFIFFCYYGMSVMQFTGKRDIWTFLKGFVAGFLMQVILTLLFTLAFTYYYFIHK